MIDRAIEFQGLSVTFNTTEDCNLACKYCYETNKKPKYLKLEDAKKFIDIILTTDFKKFFHKKDFWIVDSGLILDFIGGDSLIHPKFLDEILIYFQKKAWELNHKWKDRWRISISTNGTLFGNLDVKNFAEKYIKNLSIGISIDGCPDIHDKNRIFKDGSPSIPEILKEWKWYVDWNRRSGNTLSTKSTLNKDSIPYITESVKYLNETLNIKQINMNFIMEDMKIEEKDLILLNKELEKTMNYVLEHRHEIYLGLFDKNMSIGKNMGDINNWENVKGRCGSGCMPTLGINGKIYPCFRYLPHTVVNEEFDFYTGDIEKGFYKSERFSQVKEMTRDKISPDKCLTCPIETGCSYCIAGCFTEFGEFKRTTYICEVWKLQDKWAKQYWREYDKLEGTYTENAYLPTWFEWKEQQDEK